MRERCTNSRGAPEYIAGDAGSSDIEPNRKATAGEMAFDDSDNTAYRGNEDGTWTQASSLDGVVIKEPSKKSVRTGVFEPSATNYATVVGNVLTVAETIKDSKIGEFARAGAPASKLISSSLKSTGAVLGGVGLLSTAVQYGTGQISGTEAFFDGAFGVIGLLPIPGAALVSLGYSVFKAGYEYYTGETLFEKPKK